MEAERRFPFHFQTISYSETARMMFETLACKACTKEGKAEKGGGSVVERNGWYATLAIIQLYRNN